MKTLLWIVGKPGCGKSTIANLLATFTNAKVFHYGRLLREARQSLVNGSEKNDYEKVNQFLVDASLVYPCVIVDGNPYSSLSLSVLPQLKNDFDNILVVHLHVSDEVALNRLQERGFPIHDEEYQQKRISNFNNKLERIILNYAKTNKVINIDTEKMTPKMIVYNLEQEI